jgi:hypothetical protein
MNQILTEIEDDPTHSISLYQNWMRLRKIKIFAFATV